MADLTLTEKTIRIMEVDGDKDSDEMAAAVKHIMQKTGACTNYRYIVKGPNYSCALENNGSGWAIVDYANRDEAVDVQQKLEGYNEAINDGTVTPSEVRESLGMDSTSTDSIIYNEPGR